MKKLGILLVVSSLLIVGCQNSTSPTEDITTPSETVVEQVSPPSEDVKEPAPVEEVVVPSIDKTAEKFMESNPSAKAIVQMILSDTLVPGENTKLLYQLMVKNDERILGIINDTQGQQAIRDGFNILYTGKWSRDVIGQYDVASNKVDQSLVDFFNEITDRYIRIIPTAYYMTYANDYEAMLVDFASHLDQEGKDFLQASYNTYLAIEATKQAAYTPFDGKVYADRVNTVETFLQNYPTSIFYQQVEGDYQRLVFGYFIYENGDSAFSGSNGMISDPAYEGLIQASIKYSDSEFGKFSTMFLKVLEDSKFVRPDNLMGLINAHKAFGYHSNMEMELVEEKEPIISNYPVFKNIVNDSFTKEINDTIQGQRQAMIDSYGYNPETNKDTKAVIYTSVALTNEKIISGYTNGSFTKDADRTEYFSTFNFDLVNQIPLTILGLMTDDEVGSALLMEKIEADHSKGGYTLKDYQLDSQTIFYIDSQYLYIVVPNKYSDYPYEKGKTVLIPRREIAHILPSDL